MNYFKLRTEVMKCMARTAEFTGLLIRLKDFYEKDINSPRRFESITTIEDLITILEIRNVLSEDNVQPFKKIALDLFDDVLYRQLTEYEKLLPQTKKAINIYGAKLKQNTVFNKTQEINPVIKENIMTIYVNPYGDISPTKKQWITETILQSIGYSWSEFAINLGIKQGIIDIINNNFDTHPKKAAKVIEIYERRPDPRTWYLEIENALEKSHRCDIIKALEKIIIKDV